VLLQAGAAGCALGQRERFSLFGGVGCKVPQIRQGSADPLNYGQNSRRPQDAD